MPKNCNRQFCAECGEEMIHRDNRKHNESASALGQIIYNDGPAKLSGCDIDFVSLKILKSGDRLLRIIEQKQPSHKLKWPQSDILTIINEMALHCMSCPTAQLKLHKKSGVYIMRGLIQAAKSIDQQPCFHGNQIIEKLSDGCSKTINNHEEFFQFLDPVDKKRRSRKV